jgi:hypothetical protein
MDLNIKRGEFVGCVKRTSVVQGVEDAENIKAILDSFLGEFVYRVITGIEG